MTDQQARPAPANGRTDAPTAPLRALFVHAHPDDESLTTGGTIAALAASGVEVHVVTCTLGEEGEVLGEEFAGLVAGRADQLGGYRIGELRGALRVLGARGPRFLGGAGRWRDSGMAGTPAADHPRAFVSSGDAAVEALVDVLDELRPELVVTYDPRGGYGHPDHVRAHEVTTAAAAACAHPPRRLAWTVSSRAETARRHPEPPAGLRNAADGELPAVDDSRITHRVRLDDASLSAKVAALREHATQLELVRVGAEEEWFFALTNVVLQPIPHAEYYVAHELASGGGYTPCGPGTADLLDGLVGTRS